ncbi:MAG: hypothetical protein SGI84_13590 [Gemmatimonadota bacterium]|nr:hypothetical protein [Gemmatimonadota bacterium]
MSRRSAVRWVGLGAALLLALGCGDGPSLPSDGLLPLGAWGGKGAGVIVTDSVTHVHVGCTLGDIPGRLSLDPEGRFSVAGSYVLQAYPVMVGPSMPAVFSGRLRGRELTLTVVVQDTVSQEVVTKGPVTVEFGRDPELGPCPICIIPRSPPP